MRKKSWLFLLPLVASSLLVGAAPGHAAGEDWRVTGVESVGCNELVVDVTSSGLDGGGDYIAHTVVSSGGLIYMNEDAGDPGNGSYTWGLYSSSSYGPTTGTYPIPAGQPMKAVFTIERPKGTVLSSWTMVAASCDSDQLLYNGPTAADLDGDYLATPADKCPALAGATDNGCPVRERKLTLRAPDGPQRVAGRLKAPGYPALAADRKVKIWQALPGADKKVAVRRTDAQGRFKAPIEKGRYYATSKAVIEPAAGAATAERSRTVKVG